MLDIVGDVPLAGRALDDRENRLAERARLRELGKAPFAVEPVGREDQDDRLGASDLAIERALPVSARREPNVLVEVEKNLDETLRVQPLENACGLLLVAGR